MSDETYSVSSIKVLTAREAVRKRPGMYIGSIDANGIEFMVRGLVGDALNSHAGSDGEGSVLVGIEEAEISVTHRAAGIELRDERVPRALYESLHGRRYHRTDSDVVPIHTWLHPMIACALSARFEVESWFEGEPWLAVYEFGVPTTRKVAKYPRFEEGTSVRFVPDPSIFNGARPSEARLRAWLFEMAHLAAGTRFEIGGERFLSPQGLGTLAPLFARGGDVRSWTVANREFWIQVSVAGDAAEATTVRSWVNGERTRDGGSHEAGVAAALERAGIRPEAALIHLCLQRPTFAGCTKDKLVVDGLADAVASSLTDAFNE